MGTRKKRYMIIRIDAKLEGLLSTYVYRSHLQSILDICLACLVSLKCVITNASLKNLDCCVVYGDLLPGSVHSSQLHLASRSELGSRRAQGAETHGLPVAFDPKERHVHHT